MCRESNSHTRLDTTPMRKHNYSFTPVRIFFTFFLIISCAHTPGVVGKWREVGKTATVEFLKDGTFKAVDNQGMAVSGKYTLSEKQHCPVRFLQKKNRDCEIWVTDGYTCSEKCWFHF